MSKTRTFLQIIGAYTVGKTALNVYDIIKDANSLTPYEQRQQMLAQQAEKQNFEQRLIEEKEKQRSNQQQKL